MKLPKQVVDVFAVACGQPVGVGVGVCLLFAPVGHGRFLYGFGFFQQLQDGVRFPFNPTIIACNDS